MRRAFPSSLWALPTLAALLACYGGRGKVAIQAPAPFVLVVPVTPLCVSPGFSLTIPIGVQREKGFTEKLAWAVSAAPKGIQASFGRPGMDGGVPLFIQVGVGAPRGIVNLQLEARSGSFISGAVLALNVADPKPATGFGLEAQPLALEVPGPGRTSIPWQGPSGEHHGSVPLSILRKGFAGPLKLGVTGLPEGVQASLSAEAISAAATELGMHVGPRARPGTYPITVAAEARGELASTTFQLQLRAGTPDAGVLAFPDGYDGTPIPWSTNLEVSRGRSVTLVAGVASSRSTPFPAGVMASLSVEWPAGKPGGISAKLSAPTVPVQRVEENGEVNLAFFPELTLAADSSAPLGLHPLRLRAEVPGLGPRFLPLILRVGEGGAWIKTTLPQGQRSLLAQGQSLDFPMDLGWAGPGWPNSAEMPMAGLNLKVEPASLPPGLRATFLWSYPGPRVPLHLEASRDLPPGLYRIKLVAERLGERIVTELPVEVTPALAPGRTWIARVEWGQSVVGRDLRLVPGKEAMLRVLVMGDREGCAAPELRGRIRRQDGSLLGELRFTAPSSLSSRMGEETVANFHYARVEGALLERGESVELESGDGHRLDLAPEIGRGSELRLVLVPVVTQGVQPLLAEAEEVARRLREVWPLRSVQVEVRAPYHAAAGPKDPMGLMEELASLQAMEGKGRNYFGIYHTPPPASLLGMHSPGRPVGHGVDLRALDGDSKVWFDVILHELGHGFNLRHAPGGGAAGANPAFPYPVDSMGSWGVKFDGAGATLLDPRRHGDLMSYLPAPTWISDFNYGLAQNFLENAADLSGYTGGPMRTATWTLLAGYVRPDDSVHLSPPQPYWGEGLTEQGGGDLDLTIEPLQGQSLRLTARTYEDLCASNGYRHFQVAYPGSPGLRGLEVSRAGKTLLRRRRAEGAPTPRRDAPGTSAEILGKRLLLRWDAQRYPYASVTHEGTESRILALRLQGGRAKLPLPDLGEGPLLVRFVDDLGQALEMRVPRKE